MTKDKNAKESLKDNPKDKNTKLNKDEVTNTSKNTENEETKAKTTKGKKYWLLIASICIGIVITAGVVAYFIFNPGSFDKLFRPEIGIEIAENQKVYTGDGFRLGYEENMSVEDLDQFVYVIPESQTDILTIGIDVQDLSDPVIEGINNANCSEMSSALLTDLFQVEFDTDISTEYVALNGSEGCELSFTDQGTEILLYALNDNDKFNVLFLTKSEQTSEETYNSLITVARTFETGQEYEKQIFRSRGNLYDNLEADPENPNFDKNGRYAEEFPPVLSSEELSGKKAIIETDLGTIEMEFYPDDAPIAVSNFIFLANEDFYDSLIFHRREEGFVVQAGDPLAQSSDESIVGTGGPGYAFIDEEVTKSYDEGVVAMANSGPNTNGSQFFIMLADNETLPPQYTIFGKVINGMDIVQQIQVGTQIIDVTIIDSEAMEEEGAYYLDAGFDGLNGPIGFYDDEFDDEDYTDFDY